MEKMTHGGKVKIVELSVDQLPRNVNLEPPPGQPWGKEECRKRWENSLDNGHLQIALKCGHCGLEFILLSLRSETEMLESYQPSHGQYGGFCNRVCCPECGQRGQVGLLGWTMHPGPIYAHMGAITQPFLARQVMGE